MNSCIFFKKSIFGKTCAQIQQRDAFTYQQSEKAQIQVTIKVFFFFFYPILLFIQLHPAFYSN